MAADKKPAVLKVAFSPQSVLYIPDEKKQLAILTMENNSDVPITYKMKSTRPGLYKMRPVYGSIASKEKTTVKLIYKGLKQGVPVPTRDRFSIVFTTTNKTASKCSKLWQKHKYQAQLVNHEIKKQFVWILYKGVNDTMSIPLANPNDEDGEDAKEANHHIARKPSILSHANPDGTEAKKEPKIVIMFRDFEMSTSGSEEEDESNKEQKPTRVKSKSSPGTALAKKESTIGAKKDASTTNIAGKKESKTRQKKAKDGPLDQLVDCPEAKIHSKEQFPLKSPSAPAGAKKSQDIVNVEKKPSDDAKYVAK